MAGGLKDVVMNSRSARLSEIAKLADTDFIGEDVVIQGLGLCNRSSVYNSVLSYVASVGFIEKARNNPVVQALIITPDLYKTLTGERFSYILRFLKSYFIRSIMSFWNRLIFIDYRATLSR